MCHGFLDKFYQVSEIVLYTGKDENAMKIIK